MDNKTSSVHLEIRIRQSVAFGVDHDERRGGDFFKQKPIRIDQKVMVRAGHSRADVGEDQIGPAVKRHESITCREVTAELPLFSANGVFQRWDLHDVTLGIVEVKLRKKLHKRNAIALTVNLTTEYGNAYFETARYLPFSVFFRAPIEYSK